MPLVDELKLALEAIDPDTAQPDIEKLVADWLNSHNDVLVKMVDNHAVEAKFMNVLGAAADGVIAQFSADTKVNIKQLPIETRKVIVARLIEVLSNELMEK